MRDLLTGLAIVLVVALTTALVAPYLVDWNSQRGFLEARLSHALGQKVTIGGDIDLKLLPTPYLVLGQTVIGGDDASLQVGIRHLDLVLSPTPLLHGEFDIVQAQLGEPTLRVTLNADRSLPTLPAAPAYSADLRFDRIEVDDGTIAVADPESGRTFVVDHLDLVAEAPSLSGPFKGSGSAGAASSRTKFRFGTTAAQGNHARLRFAVDETPFHPALDIDGMLTLATSSGTTRPSFQGNVAADGHIGAGDAGPTSWRLKGPVDADPGRVALSGGELRLGNEDAGLTLEAAGTFAFRDTTHGSLALSANQLDIDRLSGPPGATPHPPPHVPDAAVLRSLAAAITLPLDLDIDVKAATWGGETLSELAAHVALGGKEPGRLSVSGDGPGNAHVALDGRLTRAHATPFAGTFDVSVRDLPDALGWLANIAPQLGVSRDSAPIQTVSAQGTLSSAGQGVAATNLRLALDRSRLSGEARYVPAGPNRSAVLSARMSASALDLDALPSLPTMRTAANGLDLDLALDANAIKVSRLGDGALDTGRLTLALTRTGERITIPHLEAADLGGATIAGTASFDATQATLSATIDAGRLQAAADLLRRLAPGRLADALQARAATLAPAKLKLDARFAVDAKGAADATRLDLAGRLGATAIDAHLVPGSDGTVALRAGADAPEGAALLAQMGLQTLPLDLLGHSRVTLTAQGKPGTPLATNIDGVFGATHVIVDGSFGWLDAAPGGSGTIAVKSADIGPVLQSAALAFPDMTGRLPVDLSGGIAVADGSVALSDLKGMVGGIETTGALKWQGSGTGSTPTLTGAIDLDHLSLETLLGLALGPADARSADGSLSSQPFSTGLVDPPRAAIKLRAASLAFASGVIAHNASLDLAVAPNTLGMGNVQASLAGGSLSGHLALRRDGTQATLEGKVALERVALDLPSVRGRLSGSLDLAGGGGNPFALASSLAGSGRAQIDDLAVSAADAAALPKVFADVEDDDVAVDGESVVRAYDATATGRLEAGTRRFKLALAAGLVRFDPADAPAALGAVSSSLAATLDLRRNAMDLTATETLRDVPKGWVGPLPSLAVVWSGPLTSPARRVEAADFLNAVAARALARETARVEAYEFDIRERAFFNARLQSETLREDDRRKAQEKAEEDARRAEAARVAAARRAAEQKAAAERAAADRAAAERLLSEHASPAPLPRGSEPPSALPPADAGRFQPAAPGIGGDPSAAGRY